jgi:class 3 adenylate cyclase
MPLCDRQSYDGPKVWFSAMVGQEPDVEVWCTEDPGKPSLLYCLIKGSKEDIEAVANPPTGTLTFLFTDIEGSTKLWERDSSVM